MPAHTEALEHQHIVRAFDEELSRLTSAIVEMGGLAERQVADALRALGERDVELAAKVIDTDRRIDELEERIDQDAIKLLALRQPMAIDLRLIAMALKITNDLERISDYAVSIAKRSQRLAEQAELRSIQQVMRIGQSCLSMVKDVLDAYVERDADKASAVWHRDSEVDEQYTSLFRELVTYMLEDPRTISTCIDFLFIAKNMERIADHATNIAEKIVFIIHGTEINRPRHEVE